MIRPDRPITTLAIAAALAWAAFASPTRAGAEDAPTPTPIRWEADLTRAAALAEEAGKPILLVQGFGEVNEPFC